MFQQGLDVRAASKSPRDCRRAYAPIPWLPGQTSTHGHTVHYRTQDKDKTHNTHKNPDHGAYIYFIHLRILRGSDITCPVADTFIQSDLPVETRKCNLQYSKVQYKQYILYIFHMEYSDALAELPTQITILQLKKCTQCSDYVKNLIKQLSVKYYILVGVNFR